MDREANLLAPENLPLSLGEFGVVTEAQLIISGVYGVIVEHPEPGFATEAFIILKDAPEISEAAKQYGQSISTYPSLLLYQENSTGNPCCIINYELSRYKILHQLPLSETESICEIAVFGAEQYPDYFGSYPVPLFTPWGRTIRHKVIFNGLSWLETERLCGLELAEQHRFDLIILDLHPPMGSTETCQCLREADVSTPILVLNDSKGKLDKIAYMELGASDCIDQPFAMSELLQRVKMDTLNSESSSLVSQSNSKRQFLGRITIDFTNSIASKDGVPLELTKHEYDILCCLASDPGRVFSRDEILKTVWDYLGYNEHYVDVFIRRLRLKIEDDPSKPQFILTRKKMGYFFAM